MSNAKHTPGPWNATWCDVLDANEVIIADCVCPNPIKGLPPAKEHEANARLIAAAPDMLLELKWLVANCRGCDGTGTHKRFNETCEYCKQPRQVIAKAEGA